jgi:hypothetical protein
MAIEVGCFLATKSTQFVRDFPSGSRTALVPLLDAVLSRKGLFLTVVSRALVPTKKPTLRALASVVLLYCNSSMRKICSILFISLLTTSGMAGDLASSFKQAVALAEAQDEDRTTRIYGNIDLKDYYQQKYSPVFVLLPEID